MVTFITVQDVDSVILYKGQDYAVCNALFKKVEHLASDFEHKKFYTFFWQSMMTLGFTPHKY